MRNTHCLLFVLAGLILFSCGKPELSPKEYISWCDEPENKLVKEYEQNEVRLTCQFMTSAYAVLKQHDPDKLDSEEIQRNIAEVSDMVQFKLTFEKPNTNNFLRDNYTTPEEFNVRSLYLSYGMQSDFSLVSGTDTVECSLLHHERTYGNTPYETVLLSFLGAEEKDSDLELIFDDQVFGLGRVKFFYPQKVLNQVPGLKI